MIPFRVHTIAELMMGFVAAGGMALSRVTAAVDPFSIASSILQGFPGMLPTVPLNDELISPMYGVDKDGKVVKVIPPRRP